MLAILLILAYLLLGLLALVLLLLALALFVPADFAASGSMSLEPPPGGSAGDIDSNWLEAPGPGAAWEDSGEDGEALPSVRGSFDGRLRWMGGAVAVDRGGVTLFGWKLRLRSRSGEAGGRGRGGRPVPGLAARGEARRRRAGTRRLGLATLRKVLPAAWAALLRSWSALSLRLKVRLLFGAGDPASTAFLAAPVAAAVYPLARAANARRPGSVGLVLKPVFHREMIAVSFDLSGRSSVFALSWPLIRVALRRDVRRLWWPGRKRGSDVRTKSARQKKEAA